MKFLAAFILAALLSAPAQAKDFEWGTLDLGLRTMFQDATEHWGHFEGSVFLQPADSGFFIENELYFDAAYVTRDGRHEVENELSVGWELAPEVAVMAQRVDARGEKAVHRVGFEWRW